MAELLDITEEQGQSAYEKGCEECLKLGGQWVHLRICLVCGKTGCCDSSPMTHARCHWEQAGHAVIRTIEPDEDWKFSYELNGFLT